MTGHKASHHNSDPIDTKKISTILQCCLHEMPENVESGSLHIATYLPACPTLIDLNKNRTFLNPHTPTADDPQNQTTVDHPHDYPHDEFHFASTDRIPNPSSQSNSTPNPSTHPHNEHTQLATMTGGERQSTRPIDAGPTNPQTLKAGYTFQKPQSNLNDRESHVKYMMEGVLRQALQPLHDDITTFTTTVNKQATALLANLQCLINITATISSQLHVRVSTMDPSIKCTHSTHQLRPTTQTDVHGTTPTQDHMALLQQEFHSMTTTAVNNSTQMTQKPIQSQKYPLLFQTQPRTDAPHMDLINMQTLLLPKQQYTTQQGTNTIPTSGLTAFKQQTCTMAMMTMTTDGLQNSKIPYDLHEFPRPPETTNTTHSTHKPTLHSQPHLPPMDTHSLMTCSTHKPTLHNQSHLPPADCLLLDQHCTAQT